MSRTQVEIARDIATRAHAGQVDKLGEPYIDHPRRVVARCVWPWEKAAAWLHDCLEDSDLTVADLRSAGIFESTIADVVALTRKPHQPSEEYYANIRATSSAAISVKLADIADNLDPARTARLDKETRDRLDKKYRKAIEELTKVAVCV